MAYLKAELRDLVRTMRRMRASSLRDAKPSRPLLAFECRPILVDTASPDEKGCLVLADGRLVAVLVRATGSGIEPDSKDLSGWHLEAGFGHCATPVPRLFNTLADAIAWMGVQLSAR